MLSEIRLDHPFTHTRMVSPDVGDNVTIYPNSTILGGKTVIGENSTIGANVFLMNSVPPDSLVIYEEKSLRILNKKDKRPSAAPEFTI